MRIGFCVWRFPNVVEPYVLDEMGGMIEAGHEVVIYAFARSGSGPEHDHVRKYRLLERCRFAESAPGRATRAMIAVGRVGLVGISQPRRAMAVLRGPLPTLAEPRPSDVRVRVGLELFV